MKNLVLVIYLISYVLFGLTYAWYGDTWAPAFQVLSFLTVVFTPMIMGTILLKSK